MTALMSLTPAAQYLRMSSEDQCYSIANQAALIQQYAKDHNFEITRTYTDEGKSGVLLAHREGLIELLDDVLSKRATYSAILVYDVSRWGRFQDSDESAFYEFICKESGIPVHYCAEPFENNGNPHDSLFKTLKRTMAGEYSRELGVKVSAGKRRITRLGFRTGGDAGFGYRRALIDENGKIRKVLQCGERKYLTTDRVRLVLGPKAERDCIRQIFAMYLKGETIVGIVRFLNDHRIHFDRNKSWKKSTVSRILRNPKYIGWNVAGMVSNRLHSPSIQVRDQEKWAIKTESFPALIDRETFEKVQEMRRLRGKQPTEAECVARARQLLLRKGKLTQATLQRFHHRYGLPTAAGLALRFGTIRRLYELAGYQLETRWSTASRNTLKTREQMEYIASKIKSTFSEHVRLFKTPPGWRPVVEIDRQLAVSLIPCASKPTSGGRACWRFRPVPQEMENITLLCLLNPERSGFVSFYLLPRIERDDWQVTFRQDSRFLKEGVQLENLERLYEEALRMDQVRRSAPKSVRK